MITAQTIRKSLLRTFERKIIPPLLSPKAGMPIILAEPPFHLPPGIKTHYLPTRPLQEKTGETEMVRHWKNVRVNSIPWPYLALLCEGEADFRIGITREMAKILKAHGQKCDSGCLVLTLQAPALILFPPNIPYSDGTQPRWERPPGQWKQTELFWTHLSPAGGLCHSSTMNTKGQYECHHSLFIRDPLLNEIYRVLYDELKSRSPNHERTTLAQLQTMMLRLQRRIAHDTPQVANTTWSTPSMNRPIAGQSRNIELLTKLHEYIHIHLREPLPLKRLSAQAGLSPTHLNRLFRAHHGTSAVHYVIQVRMDAARTIIAESPNLAIKEIMHLVGYSDQAHFSHAFSKAHGLPPRTFRNQCLKITALADRV